ncbi:hypothetical protein [Ferrimonas aestuarii]|uniref:Uncharacterized protein n=1 Tax=Ferrimonas aestuarii TaxID=2569539 RepID=A0A4U1BPY9_9GAMM|nr:hypothetical protein [Ferrimonas aestuarii]TKB56030.1 hypothetical protein FCL42_07370 [Ferrimonas aestuarii]
MGIQRKAIRFKHELPVVKENGDWFSTTFTVVYDSDKEEFSRNIEIKVEHGAFRETLFEKVYKYTFKEWFELVKYNEKVYVINYDEEDEEHIRLFNHQRDDDASFFVINIFDKESQSYIEIPFASKKNVTAFNWYSAVFIPTMQEAQNYFSADIINARIDALEQQKKDVDVYRDKFRKDTINTLEGMSRGAGSTWYPGNKERYDSCVSLAYGIDNDLKHCLNVITESHHLLANLREINDAFSNFSKCIVDASSHMSRQIPGFELNKYSKTLRHVSNAFYGVGIGVTVLGAATPLVFVGSAFLITAFILDIQAAKKLKNWYVEQKEELSNYKNGSLADFKRSVTKIHDDLSGLWKSFLDIGRIIAGSDHSFSSARELKFLFEDYVESYTYMMRLKSGLYISMLNDPEGDVLQVSKKIVAENKKNTDKVDVRDKVSQRKLDKILAMRSESIALDYLLQAYGEASDQMTRDHLRSQIEPLADKGNVNLEVELIMSVLTFSNTPMEVLEEAALSKAKLDNILKEMEGGYLKSLAA